MKDNEEEEDDFSFTPQVVTKPDNDKSKATSNKAKGTSNKVKSENTKTVKTGKDPPGTPRTARPISALSRHGISPGGRDVQRQDSVNLKNKKTTK